MPSKPVADRYREDRIHRKPEQNREQKHSIGEAEAYPSPPVLLLVDFVGGRRQRSKKKRTGYGAPDGESHLCCRIDPAVGPVLSQDE